MMAELIRKEDTLNEGREKLNEAIKDSNMAKEDSSEALDKADTALANSESTQTQLDTIVIEGDSSVEAAQARVDKVGKTYDTLKDRLDTENEKVTSQLADEAQRSMNKSFYDSLGSSRKRRPIMTIVDDDGKSEFYTLIKPILEEFKVPIASALITSIVGHTPEYMSEDQVRELHELGAEFVSHTHTHKNLNELWKNEGIEAVERECHLS